MTWWMWTIAVTVPYLAGYPFAFAIAQRTCDKVNHEKDCEHGFDAALWPLFIAFVVFIGPIYATFVGLRRFGEWMAEVEVKFPERRKRRSLDQKIAALEVEAYDPDL